MFKLPSALSLLLDELRRDHLSDSRGKGPASLYLNKTHPVYEFVRVTLGIWMHGFENYHRFSRGLGVEDITVGQPENISLIHEVCFSLFPTEFLAQFICSIGSP